MGNLIDGLLFLKRADGAVLQVPGFPTTFAGLSTLNIDFGSLNSATTVTVISISNPASVGFDFGALP